MLSWWSSEHTITKTHTSAPTLRIFLEATTNNNHGQAAGDTEGRLQQLTQTSQTYPRAVEPRHRPRHESGAGKVTTSGPISLPEPNPLLSPPFPVGVVSESQSQGEASKEGLSFEQISEHAPQSAPRLAAIELALLVERSERRHTARHHARQQRLLHAAGQRDIDIVLVVVRRGHHRRGERRRRRDRRGDAASLLEEGGHR